jgi:hypothetical protein
VIDLWIINEIQKRERQQIEKDDRPQLEIEIEERLPNKKIIEDEYKSKVITIDLDLNEDD